MKYKNILVFIQILTNKSLTKFKINLYKTKQTKKRKILKIKYINNSVLYELFNKL